MRRLFFLVAFIVAGCAGRAIDGTDTPHEAPLPAAPCSAIKEKTACETRGCFWLVCPPNADCAYSTECIDPPKQCPRDGCPVGYHCEDCMGSFTCVSDDADC